MVWFSILDFSTDGRWCYIVLWVAPNPSSLKVDWESLKSRLVSICPSCAFPVYLNQHSNNPLPSPVYLLKFLYLDWKGLLHGNQNECFKVFVLSSLIFFFFPSKRKMVE